MQVLVTQIQISKVIKQVLQLRKGSQAEFGFGLKRSGNGAAGKGRFVVDAEPKPKHS